MSKHNPPSAKLVATIPRSVVVFDRWIYFIGLLIAFVLQTPLLVTVLLGLKVLPLLFGGGWSLTGRLARFWSNEALNAGAYEDRRLIRFNGVLVVVLLAGAHGAFFAGAPAVGWSLVLTVAAAIGGALLGFCVGCVLFYRLRLYRYRLFGR